MAFSVDVSGGPAYPALARFVAQSETAAVVWVVVVLVMEAMVKVIVQQNLGLGSDKREEIQGLN
jgi:hypothetical protein